MADSTTEAEYIAACETAKEGVWIRNFLDDLGIFPASVKPLDLYCDNSGAIVQAKEPKNHHKTRHIDWKYRLIQKIIKSGDVELCKIHTDASGSDDPSIIVLPISQSVEHNEEQKEMTSSFQ